MAESGEGLRKAAHSALVQCMAVSRGESVLVITDEELREVGYAFWEEARELGAEAIHRLEVKDFPVTVINDPHGNDLYEEGIKPYTR